MKEEIIIERVPAQLKVKFKRSLHNVDSEETVELKIAALEELERCGFHIQGLKFTGAVYAWRAQELNFDIL